MMRNCLMKYLIIFQKQFSSIWNLKFCKNKESESKHNYGYWQHKEYLGVGAGAVGYINKQRQYPSKVLKNISKIHYFWYRKNWWWRY